MGVLLDSSILISAERGRVEIEDRLRTRGDEPFFLSVVGASELLHGVDRAHDLDVQARRAAYVEAILATFPLLDIDLPTARSHARLWASLTAAGTPIGPHDTWIAATCLAHGLHIATMNVREFRRVPGLIVEDWS